MSRLEIGKAYAQFVECETAYRWTNSLILTNASFER
jgi:hypothetical protein